MSTDRRTFLVLGGAALIATAVPPGPAAATASAQQSPIDIRTDSAQPAPHLPRLIVEYPTAVDLTVTYVSREPNDCGIRGPEETVEAEVPPGSAAVELGGVRYELEQFHFHTPSEHRLNGRRFPLEQHFVHRSAAGKLLVLGLFLTGGGRGNLVQDRVLQDLPVECGEEIHVAGANLASALPSHLTTFRYPGSLTTAPYSEGVKWLVLDDSLRVSDASRDGLQQLFPSGNSRAVQPLGDRVVLVR